MDSGITYLRSCALDLAMDDVRTGWLKPKAIAQQVRFNIGRWLKGNHFYYKHSLTVDGVWITDYYSDSKDLLTEKHVIEILAGDTQCNAPHVDYDYGSRAWEQLRTNSETWALQAFDHRNFRKFGMTVGSIVTIDDANYLGGAPTLGEVAEVDPEDENLPICVRIEGWPYLYLHHSELKVRKQPVKVPMAITLPQELNR